MCNKLNENDNKVLWYHATADVFFFEKIHVPNIEHSVSINYIVLQFYTS